MTRIWPLPCEGLGNHSYLAEVAEGLALAVDPGRDPRPYLGLAAAHGLRVAFTADTHVHADFVSGSRELAAAGARLLAPAGSGLSFPHEGLRDGGDLDLGGLTLRAHPGAPELPAARRRSAGGGVHRRRADRGRGGPHRPGRPRQRGAVDPGGLPLRSGPAWPAR